MKTKAKEPVKKKNLINTGSSSIGWHKFGEILTCPRKYQHSVILKTEGSGSFKSRSLGTAIHQALAHHYVKFSMPDYFRDENLAEPADAIVLSLGKSSESLKHALFLWKLYTETYPWSLDDQQWEIMDVEEELWTEIDGEKYCQRADLVARRKSDKKVFIWDHKTAGGFGAAYGTDQFTMSGQIVGLRYIGQKLYGKSFGDVLINLIRTSPTNQAQRFIRQPPPAALSAVEEFPKAIIHARRLIKQYAEEGHYPQVLDPTICAAYRGCDFLTHCRLG